jgi:hypothetical protein
LIGRLHFTFAQAGCGCSAGLIGRRPCQYSGSAADGAGGLVAHYVARLYIDPATGQGQCVGYFTDIAGITASLFSAIPREDTAYFTFRSDMFQLSPLQANGDLQPDLFSAGSYAIYFNRQPTGDWSDPGTFSSGQPIATFKRPESFVSLLPQTFHSVIREELVSTQPSVLTDTHTISAPSHQAA